MGFRQAEEREDDELAVVLYNAFLPIWNHNWFQGLREPLPPADSHAHLQSLPDLSRSRYAFYRALIKAVRLLKGQVLVNESDDEPRIIQAILLWLPPHARLQISSVATLMSSGMFSAMLSYGAAGIYRLNFTFEGNIAKLFKQANVDDAACGFVQMLASNPKCAGRRASSRLLEWQMARHWERLPSVPIVLDTTTEQAIRAYEKLGFDILGSIPVRSGTDKDGFKLAAGATEEVRTEAKQVTIQRIMLAKPPSSKP